MAATDYIINFDALNYLRVHILAERGRVMEFTAQYEAEIGGVVYPVVRYDTAHGYPHRDLLDAAGRNVDKFWLAGWEAGTALDHAIRDLKAHWRQYRADFEARLVAGEE